MAAQCHDYLAGDTPETISMFGSSQCLAKAADGN
jgi:hypothetical protein